jgi:hypothetical protein
VFLKWDFNKIVMFIKKNILKRSEMKVFL